MKKIHLYACLALLFASSCSPEYYQMHTAVPIGKNMSIQADAVIYEDANCLITYHFWEDGGNMGFLLYNKTNQPLYLYKDKSFFIVNGIARDYFQNRSFSSAKSVSTSAMRSGTLGQMVGDALVKQQTSVASSAHTGYAVTFLEEKTVCVPAKTAKRISEFSISDALFRSCDLLRFPRGKKEEKVNFEEKNSPLVFGNRLTYAIGEGAPTEVENMFYVSEVGNYNRMSFFEYRATENCGKKGAVKPVFKRSAPQRFFIPYTQSTNNSSRY